MPEFSEFMRGALELARRGQGHVEPNPPVGCLLVQQDDVVGQGWHRKFGGPHAEVEAIANAGAKARGATMFVTLEPCCHQGKTPPCTAAILAAEIARVVVAEIDPFPKVSGGGIAMLEQAGVEVIVGIEADAARQLTAPYRKLVTEAKPWVIAKWAMTLDGKMATHAGDSKWITNDASRSVAHRLRGRVDAVVVGSQTAQTDDPLLTARPPGARVATRIVLDTAGALSPSCQLARTARQFPTMVVTREEPSATNRRQLRDAGCELLVIPSRSRTEQLSELLLELGRRQFTNILLEGGGELLGSAFDAGMLDEVHVFIAPKLLGGSSAIIPLAGDGRQTIGEAAVLESLQCEEIEGDFYLHGRLR